MYQSVVTHNRHTNRDLEPQVLGEPSRTANILCHVFGGIADPPTQSVHQDISEPLNTSWISGSASLDDLPPGVPEPQEQGSLFDELPGNLDVDTLEHITHALPDGEPDFNSEDEPPPGPAESDCLNSVDLLDDPLITQLTPELDHNIGQDCDGDDGTIPRPAKTLKTAKRRLGLDSDAYIVQIPICTVCFKLYTHEDIKAAYSPNCTGHRCQGIFYHEKWTATATGTNVDNEDAGMKCIPAKIHCYSPIEKAVARFLLCQDFVENLQNTSQDSDQPSITDETIMHDIHDAEG
ncbi:hypothetical protein C0993_006939 [Termitomyces sp. T159_Od127]|nr:hypothetical protein C0993_006939 [Termitomyces sp. T159_Od127]